MKAPSTNIVILAGNLAKDPELKYTTGGTSVLNLYVINNKPRKDKAGEWVNDSFGIGAILFGEAAERKAGTLHKGQAVIIEGRLQSREWDNKDNQRRKVVEIVASRVHSLEPQAKSEGEPSTGDSEPMPLPEPVDDVPF